MLRSSLFREPLATRWLAGALALLVLHALPGHAASGGPDADGYQWHDAADGCPSVPDSFVFPEAASFWDGGLQNTVGPIDLGFAIAFHDIVTTRIWVNRSGLVFFEAPPDLPLDVPQAIPTADAAGGFLAPYWAAFDELSQDVDCVFWDRAPGSFRLGWRALLDSNGSELRWELYIAADGSMRVEYLDIGIGPFTGTIGMESPDQSTGLQVYRNGVPEDPGFVYGSPSPFSICYAPPADCGPTPLGCNSSVSDSTGPGASAFDSYGCTGLAYDGPEDVYTFVNPVMQTVSFAIDAAANLDVILLDGCDPLGCRGIGDVSLERELEPGTYRVIVDGRSGASGPYELSVVCGNALEPSTLRINGAEGECFDETKTAWLSPDIPKADVLFAIDLTSSMGEERSQLQTNMQTIIDQLELFISDVAFGLVHYRDYDATGFGTVPCVFDASNFGDPGDYPYQLAQPITSSRAVIQAAVDGLPPTGGGNDFPEAYSRVLWEAVHDAGIAWRPGARRIVVNFGDELPHDCNVLACLGGMSPARRGVDLGPDNAPAGGDDLLIMDVIQEMIDARIALVHLDSGEALFGGRSMDGAFTYTQIWNCWAQSTGGVAQALNGDGTVPSGVDLAELIGDVIEEQSSRCSAVELVVEPGFEDWLVSASPVYADVDLPARLDFDIRICVPVGTPPGTYSFQVQLLCSGGLVAVQQVIVEVGVFCQPAIVAGPSDETICLGEMATLDASGIDLVNCEGTVDYAWQDDLGMPAGTGSMIDVVPARTTVYTVDVSCSADPACGTSDQATVTVNPVPVVEAGADREVCAPASIALDDADGGIGTAWFWDDGGAGGSFLPAPDQLHPSYENAAPGTYRLTLRSTAAGCESSDTLQVDVHPNPSVDAGADKRSCEGELVALTDAATDLGDDFSWDDGGAGGSFAPSSAVLNPSWSGAPAGDHVLTLTVTDSATGCTSFDTVQVRLDPLPRIASATARDINDCNLGIELAWEAAVFPSGSGVYNVYRSEISCADASSRPPILEAFTGLTWNDRSTASNGLYYYVVEAEDSDAGTVCTPRGPAFGGAVARACVDPPVLDEGTASFPEGVYATLFAAHEGQEITLEWPAARALLPGETFRLLKASGDPTETWATVNGTMDLGREYSETDTASRRQFFDLRVANECGDLSLDEFPPSR